MQDSFQLDVVKPDRGVLSEIVKECMIPGAGGYFGVRPGHAPLLTVLGTGELMYRTDSGAHYLALSGGFCEVTPERVTVLAELAERADEIDVPRAERASKRADEHIAQLIRSGGTGDEIAEAQAALARANLRLKVARSRRPGV